jgi:DCN1-like protein 1/2
MKTVIEQLRSRSASDPSYFTKVYNHTFDYVRPAGARSLGLDTAIPFWGLLIPHGLRGGAIAHRRSSDEEDSGEEEGWIDDYNQYWFDFLNAKGGKGVSKDTWSMVSIFDATSCTSALICWYSSLNLYAPSIATSINTMLKVR